MLLLLKMWTTFCLSRCHHLGGSAGKTRSIHDMNVLRLRGYLRQLKTKNLNQVCSVLQYIGVDIMGESIQACHWLNKQNDRTIVTFSMRKNCEHVMRKKSELRKLKTSTLDLPNGTKLYINKSLYPYHRGLWNQCKKLWNRPGIFSFFTVNGSISIKIRENGSYNIITQHIDNLKDIFPDEDFSTS